MLCVRSGTSCSSRHSNWRSSWGTYCKTEGSGPGHMFGLLSRTSQTEALYSRSQRSECCITVHASCELKFDPGRVVEFPCGSKQRALNNSTRRCPGVACLRCMTLPCRLFMFLLLTVRNYTGDESQSFYACIAGDVWNQVRHSNTQAKSSPEGVGPPSCVRYNSVLGRGAARRKVGGRRGPQRCRRDRPLRKG